VNKTRPLTERLQEAFRPTERGVVGVVDELLVLCREQGLRLAWHADRCRIEPLGGEPQEPTELPLPKSVFRAMLARLAALCNERSPQTISPYGGEGELVVGSDPSVVYCVALANTPGEQSLEVRLKEQRKDVVGEDCGDSRFGNPAAPVSSQFHVEPKTGDA
jgi:hypothetical protein